MKFIVLDQGSISPAYFSQPAIKYLLSQGHSVEILHSFDAQKCAEADVVWSEWCNGIAFQAAESGLCKRLVLRMRGYDLWYPLDTLAWVNVDALLYESQSLQDMAEERFPHLKGKVLPAGIDLSRFPFKERQPGNVIAMVARVISDKGYQLALEWARQNPEYALHMTMLGVESNPRLVGYLRHSAPPNVTLYEGVDTAVWLESIQANFLLLPSIWETLSYTTAEAMAMGIKPLIHDFPGALRNWPEELVWQSFADLNRVIRGPYESGEYRRLVEANLDGAQRSEEFSKLLHELAQKPSALVQTVIRDPFSDALATGDFGKLEEAFDVVSPQVDAAGRSAMALQIASLYYEQDFLSRAKYWALQSLCDGPRADAFCLLGEIAVEDDLSTATLWYEFAHDCEDPRSRFVLKDLVQGRTDRAMELIAEVEKFWEVCDAPPLSRFVVVVPVRNGEAWIGKCLESVRDQRTVVPISVVVIDDASTDNTGGAIDEAFAKFPIEIQTRVIRNTIRLGALCNTVMGAKTTPGYQNQEDVIVVLDGDDWFSTENALSTIAVKYAQGAWATYGSWKDTSGNLSWMRGYPSGVVEQGTYRRIPWAATHVKTFKRHLLDRIQEKDFKDDAGNWFMIAGDVALMMPILEMAGERARYISDVLYTYNVENPNNDLKVAPVAQLAVRGLICSREPYKPLQAREVPKRSALLDLLDAHPGLLEEHAVRTIVEVGAADGTDTAEYAERFPSALIHAFEPSPLNCERLRANVRQYANRVNLHEIALSDCAGNVAFWESGGTTPSGQADWAFSGSLLQPAKHTDIFPWCTFNKITVSTQRLDHYLQADAQIDLVHLDVQGAELLVLKGAGDLVKRVQAVWLEVSNIEMYKNQPLARDVADFLRSAGFHLAIDTLGKGISGDQFWRRKM